MQDIEALREFVKRTFYVAWRRASVDGDELDQWGVELGLLTQRIATKQDVIDSPYILVEGEPMFEFSEKING